MFKKFFHFIKYNNATVIILALIIILGGSALAAGPEAIGEKQTSVQGLDNTALLAAELDKFSMDFKIEKIAEDDKYYYATYSFMDLTLANQVWQYQLSQKTQKVSKKIKQDLGEYLAKFLAKHYEARMRELKKERNQALAAGEQRRIEVTAYSGLIGRTLDLAAKVFSGYEPVKKRELLASPLPIPPPRQAAGEGTMGSGPDNLTKIYNDYLASHPDLISQLNATTTPAETAYTASSTSAQFETTATTTAPTPEPTSVQVIDLPSEPAPAAPAEPAPVELTPAESAPVEPTPAETELAPAPAPVETAPVQ